MLQFNPSEVQDFLTPGAYRAKIKQVEYITNKNTGNDGAQFNLLTHTQAETKLTLWLTEKALFRLARFAKATTFPADQLNRRWGDRELCDALIGHTLCIICADEWSTKDHRYYTNVVGFRPVAEWSEELHAKCAAEGDKRTGPTPGDAQEPSGATTSNPDDDLTF